MHIGFVAAATSSTALLASSLYQFWHELVISGSVVHKSLHLLLSSVKDLEWLGLVRALE